MTNPAAEGGEVETALAPVTTVTGGLLERWVEGDHELALKKIDTLVLVMDKLRSASIKSTYPSDWIIHTSKDADGNVLRQVGYLQDVGAERAGKIWGIEIDEPVIEREEFPDGTYAYKMTASAWSKVTGERMEHAQGSRWSGDNFFARQKGPDEKPDPTDVAKAAYANLHGRAVRSLAGLGGVPLEKLREGGVDITKVVMIGYEKGGKGGESTGATVGASDVTMGWGDSKGKTPAELTDKDLAYYLGAYQKGLADPAKAKFAKANQRGVDALKAEQARRTQTAEQREEGAGDAASNTMGVTDGEGNPRGKKISALWTTLLEVCVGADGKPDQKLVMAVLRQATSELFGTPTASLSDLSDEQLDKLNEAPKELLRATAEALKTQAAGKK